MGTVSNAFANIASDIMLFHNPYKHSLLRDLHVSGVNFMSEKMLFLITQ